MVTLENSFTTNNHMISPMKSNNISLSEQEILNVEVMQEIRKVVYSVNRQICIFI